MSNSESSPPPFSKSADKNKDHILEQLRLCLNKGDRVLEIASGTGQHALHFGSAMQDVTWQSSDRDLDHFNLRDALQNTPLSNVFEPIVIDIAHWPNLRPKFDAVYSANCLHVIPEELVQNYVEGAARSLKPGGAMLLYGPFKYGGKFTTESNESFDGFLRDTYEGGGIRDFEVLNVMAGNVGFEFESDTPMPANNQFLVWRKATPK